MRARDRIALEVSRYTDDIYETMVRDADMLFAIRWPSNASAMDMAQQRYGSLLKRLKEFDVISQLDNQTRARLYMPQRLQDRAQHPCLKVSRLSFTADDSAVSIKWSEEVKKEPTEVLRMYQLGSADPVQVSLLGTMEFEPVAELLELATVKTCQIIVILVKDGKAVTRRLAIGER